jgi:acyl-CoA synthetase (AMP-forming)/AMP-acid ligase II
MDASRPAQVDPRSILAAIRDHAVTHMFGSPALLNRVSRYAIAHSHRLANIKRVMTAGAPVPVAVLERMRRILRDSAEIFTPYGATEALPIASIESREILGETAAQTARGAGICVGRPLAGIDVRIIAITDGPIPEMVEAQPLASGEIGEICVRGPVVTREYFRHPNANAGSKIVDGDTLWHRMGDVGYLDDAGRLWFCGRKSHRVQTARRVHFTICCEAVFNQHPDVYRTALVGVGPAGLHRPVLCVELERPEKHVTRRRIECELRELAAAHEHTRNIETFLFHKSFPVDVRHNAKIFREKLAIWAAKMLQP